MALPKRGVAQGLARVEFFPRNPRGGATSFEISKSALREEKAAVLANWMPAQ